MEYLISCTNEVGMVNQLLNEYSCNTADPYGAFLYVCFSSSLKYQDNGESESVSHSVISDSLVRW